jgi:hypothetical protein
MFYNQLVQKLLTLTLGFIFIKLGLTFIGKIIHRT